MASFEGLVEASDEALLKLAWHTGQAMGPRSRETARIAEAARVLGMNAVQFACALGFRAQTDALPEVATLLGLGSTSTLLALRDHGYLEDVYHRLRIRDLLALYGLAANGLANAAAIQKLLPERLRQVEGRIEATVNPLVIERYKKEVRAFYGSGLATSEFALGRLADLQSGFRALTSEALLLAEHRVFDPETLFNLPSLLAQERKRLFRRGHVPREMVVERLARETLPTQERRVLEAALART